LPVSFHCKSSIVSYGIVGRKYQISFGPQIGGLGPFSPPHQVMKHTCSRFQHGYLITKTAGLN